MVGTLVCACTVTGIVSKAISAAIRFVLTGGLMDFSGKMNFIKRHR